MAVELFGFRIGRADEEVQRAAAIPSFAPPPNEDGAIEVASGGVYGQVLDVEGTAKNEAELVTKYRELSMQPECERAIEDIVNEAIVTNERSVPVELNLDQVKQPERVKNRIREEFYKVGEMLDLSNISYDIFKRWYIDGRLYYHIMIDESKPREGIQELRYIDPRRIRKVREPAKRINNKPPPPRGLKPAPAYNEYYLYNHSGIGAQQASQGIKISPDSICHIHCGLMDGRNKMILGHLQKAIKPMNQLRMLEDAVVIYRLARAPERRIFYIDVGNLPKMKAEQYLRDMMTKHKNKLVYDANTGEVRDDRKFMTMLEDYWLPRREGGRGTEITTLPGGQNLGEMEDVDYFRKKLYMSLNVPVSRLEADNAFNLGRASEISRDELKFTKFVSRLRNRFSMLFDELLEIQLALTGVMSRAEWRSIKNSVKYDFMKDNYFTELKEQELINSRLSILQQAEAFEGKFFSAEWIRKHVLRFTEDEIAEIDAQMKSEADDTDQPQDEPPQEEEYKPDSNNQIVEIHSSVEPEKPLSEEDKLLIESMTKALDKVTKDEIKDDL